MQCATFLGLLLLGCSTRAAPVPPGSAQHSPAEPRPELHASPKPDASADAGGNSVRSSTSFVLKGGSVFGVGRQNLLIDSGRVIALGVNPSPSDRIVDVTGRYIMPGFVDSHVHLAYDPVGDDLLASGIVAVLDLGAPLSALKTNHGSLRVQNSGPMITAPRGYPTTSWGQDGYGLEVGSPAAGAAAVQTLFLAGAQVIKVPLTGAPTLDDATVKAVVLAAHGHKLKVYAHALEEANASRAAADGVDVLAHTPTEALSEATLDAWKTRTVISTLSAFGGGAAAVKNLRDLRERGARVLYGTDLGNTRDTNIQAAEIDLLVAAGFDGASIVRAGTSVPAEFLGLTELGSLEVGKCASFLVLGHDPSVDPHTLSEPIAVYVDGVLVSAGL
jgi:imidazolonepropionase-like amidohydrolase